METMLSAIGMASFAAALLVALFTTRRRSEIVALFETANKELRAQVKDSQDKIAVLTRQNAEQGGEIRTLRELVTQRAAVEEIGGYLADLRHSASAEHQEIVAQLRAIAGLLGDRRAA